MTWAAIVAGELRKCTACGLCLSACPTFVRGRSEGDSPRGRIRITAELAAGVASDPVASDHLGGCIECGACHDPCPTGVRFATARRTHRAATERLDLASFGKRVAELSDLIERDAGASLTIQSVRALLAKREDAQALRCPAKGGITILGGQMLELAAPGLASRLKASLADHDGPIMTDRALLSALDRASGLLHDVGLNDEHDQAVAEVAEIVSQHGYEHVIVAVLDRLSLRLRDEPLPPQIRVVPVPEVFPSLAWPTGTAGWEEGAGDDRGRGSIVPFPAELRAGSAPVLLHRRALSALRELTEAKGAWLAGRLPITADPRDLVRFPGARHPAELAMLNSVRAGDT